MVRAALLALGLVSCGSGRKHEKGCRLDITGPTGEVGFGAEVELRATETCDGPPSGAPIVWSTGAAGSVLRLRTPTAEERLLLGSRPGILPVSADQGYLRVEARAGGATSEFELLLAHRHSGLPSIPVGVGVYVYGGAGGSIQRFEAPHSGRFPVKDAATGFEVPLMAGRPDVVPQDCGRPDCHASEAAAHQRTRHASALERALGAPPRGHDARCQRCHAVGAEPGIAGGFFDVAEQVGFRPFPARAMTWEELPRDLRRLGNVGCIACHGTGKIPEPAERALEYSVGVCAQCHDAPPRYAIVRDWRASRMSQLPRETLQPACAGCHTAQSFVARLRHREVRIDPATADPVACAACHDPHGPGSANPHLVRVSADGAGLSALCARCHTADLDATPERRFALRLAPMAPQSLLAPPNCIDCHRPHTFRAEPPAGEREARARALVSELATAKADLERALPELRGCNRRASTARHVAVVSDRLALVDAAGVPLGDCNDDGAFDGAEDPWVENAVAARLYPRAYELFVVERDKSRGVHSPEGASRRIRQALDGL
jgi:predicted CXXCH cytochrome family protein